LVVAISVGDFRLPAPEAYQVDSMGQEVSTGWTPSYSVSDSVVTFSGSGSYDTSQSLVISLDRTNGGGTSGSDNLEWCSYFGGNHYDEHYGSDVNLANNFAVTGLTFSKDFPNVNGSYIYVGVDGFSDAYISLFDQDMNLSWSTYLGGKAIDEGRDIIFSGEKIYATGITQAIKEDGDNPAEFPLEDNGSSYFNGSNPCSETAPGACIKMYVAIINQSGLIEHATFFGDDETTIGVYSISAASNGDLWLGGFGGIPFENLGTETILSYGGSGFVAQFSSNLTDLEWSSSFVDVVRGVDIDNNGNVFVIGEDVVQIGQTGLPPLAENSNSDVNSFSGGTRDVVAAKISPTPHDLEWFTYIGGSGFEEGAALKVDNTDGSVVFTGYTDSSSGFLLEPSGVTGSLNQTTFGGSFDAFITKYTNDADLIASTYYGASGFDEFKDIAIDENGNMLLAGSAQSGLTVQGYSNFYSQNFISGTFPTDGHILGLSSDFVPIWSTYFGGEGADFINTIDLSEGYFYLGGNVNLTTLTDNDNFPLMQYAANPNSYYLDAIDEDIEDLSNFFARFSYSTLTSSRAMDVSSKRNLQVFPNPTNDILNVQLRDMDAVTLSVINLNGQILKTIDVSKQNNVQISLAGYPSSTYFIMVEGDYGRVTQRVLLSED